MATVVKSRRIFELPSSGGGGSAADGARITILENNEYKVTYFESISAATGAVTEPTNSTILLDQFQGGVDAFVSTVINGQPSGEMPVTSSGVTVDVSSFDALGNYTLSGTPSGYPVALIYIIKIKAIDWVNLTTANILDAEGSINKVNFNADEFELTMINTFKTLYNY